MGIPELDSAVEWIATLPGIGRRSAMRIALYLLKSEPWQVRQLSEALLRLVEELGFCQICGGLSSEPECAICTNEERCSSGSLCVVEEPGDLLAIENTGAFPGTYHVLMGALSPLDGIMPSDLRLEELWSRIETEKIEELFIATNPTLEGDATANYIQENLQSRFQAEDLRITRIAHGIATGGNIEYADANTLAHSIRSRSEL